MQSIEPILSAALPGDRAPGRASRWDGDAGIALGIVLAVAAGTSAWLYRKARVEEHTAHSVRMEIPVIVQSVSGDADHGYVVGERCTLWLRGTAYEDKLPPGEGVELAQGDFRLPKADEPASQEGAISVLGIRCGDHVRDAFQNQTPNGLQQMYPVRFIGRGAAITGVRAWGKSFGSCGGVDFDIDTVGRAIHWHVSGELVFGEVSLTIEGPAEVRVDG